jgi:peroxiredoxin
MLKHHSTAIRCLLSIVSIFAIVIFLLAGCEIEKSKEGLAGYIYVSLSDSSGTSLPGAQIKLDGVVLSQVTPALITTSVDSHTVSVFKPDYLRVTNRVSVSFHDTTMFQAVTDSAEEGVMVLDGVPDGTVLLLNTVARDTTPPAIFPVGEGDYFVSAFLPGFATAMPAKWNISVVAGDTIHLAPTFEAAVSGARPDSLAPLFALMSDSFSHGQVFSLAENRGKVVVVNFFDYNCPNCIAEFPEIQTVYVDPEFAGNIQFFAIDSRDAYQTFNQFRTDHAGLGVQFPMLWGTMQHMEDHYRVDLNPSTFVIDQTGRIRYYNRGVINASMLHGWIEGLLGDND